MAKLQTFPPELHAQKSLLIADRVGPSEEVEASYHGTAKLPRGIYTLGPGAIGLSDPFGWFRLEKRLEESSRLKVYPRIQDFGVSERLGECLAYLAADSSRLGSGQSLEFFSVREYMAGDPLRRIHWRLTARRGSPVVREYSRLSTGDLTVFLDLCRLALIGVGRGNSLEHAVRIAAATTSRAVRQGYRVALGAGEDPAFQVPLGGGRTQVERILDVLVAVKPTSAVPLPRILAARAHEVLPGSTVLVPLSPYLFGDEELESELAAWRRRGVRVLAAVFDPLTFRYVWGHPGERATLAECCQRLRSLGVHVYQVACAACLPAVFSPQVGRAPP